LAVRLDGAEGDGSLKTVGGTHGVSPLRVLWKVHPACFFINQVGEAATPERRRPEKHLSYLVNSSCFRAPTLERQVFFFGLPARLPGLPASGARLARRWVLLWLSRVYYADAGIARKSEAG